MTAKVMFRTANLYMRYANLDKLNGLIDFIRDTMMPCYSNQTPILVWVESGVKEIAVGLNDAYVMRTVYFAWVDHGSEINPIQDIENHVELVGAAQENDDSDLGSELKFGKLPDGLNRLTIEKIKPFLSDTSKYAFFQQTGFPNALI